MIARFFSVLVLAVSVALPALAETKANQLFGSVTTPSDGRPMPYGSYATVSYTHLTLPTNREV